MLPFVVSVIHAIGMSSEIALNIFSELNFCIKQTQYSSQQSKCIEKQTDLIVNLIDYSCLYLPAREESRCEDFAAEDSCSEYSAQDYSAGEETVGMNPRVRNERV